MKYYMSHLKDFLIFFHIYDYNVFKLPHLVGYANKFQFLNSMNNVAINMPKHCERFRNS